MPRYCIDMSGLSNPAQQMPQDIYTSLWVQIKRRIVAGVFATTPKVYEELTNLLSPIGECIAQNKDRLVYEVGIAHWDYECYLGGKEENKHEHKKFHVAEAGVGKQCGIGLHERDGRTIAIPIPDTTKVLMAKELIQ